MSNKSIAPDVQTSLIEKWLTKEGTRNNFISLYLQMKLNLTNLTKDQFTKIIIISLIVLFIALISSLNTAANMPKMVEREKPQITKTPITLSHTRQPWDLNDKWNAQEMPVLTSAESHQRFIELCEKYNLPADVIWHTENYYWLKEWTILCISIAETSWGKPWTYWEPWCWNYGNVGNNDRGHRRCFANQWAWLAAIGQTLNNDNLGNNQTIACLNGAGDCIEPNASSKRYSTWRSWNRQRNLIGCFYSIYQTPIDPQTFNLHNR